MNRIYESEKLDIALVPQALNDTNVTGKYHPVKNYGRILALLAGGAMAATKTTKVELLQAVDNDGTDAKGIPTTAAQAATATITANALVTECTVTLATFLAGGTITINGLVFTAHATVTTPANREFSIAGSDTQDAVELCLCINDATYGVPGVKASNAAGVVTLVSKKPGEVVITMSSNPDDGTCVKATIKAQSFVEISTDKMDFENVFNHVAAKVTTTANTTVSVALIRGAFRLAPVQKVGASAIY